MRHFYAFIRTVVPVIVNVYKVPCTVQGIGTQMLQYGGGSSKMPHMEGGHIDKYKVHRRIELK